MKVTLHIYIVPKVSKLVANVKLKDTNQYLIKTPKCF